MKNKDFQVGDKVTVYSSELGQYNSIVEDIDKNSSLPIIVGTHRFTEDGKRFLRDRLPSLYHGWNLAPIKGKEPVRYPWANIHKSPQGDYIVSFRKYRSQKEAMNGVDCLPVGYRHIRTIQLKPNRE